MVLDMAELAYFFDETIFALVLKNTKKSSCIKTNDKKKTDPFSNHTILGKYTLNNSLQV